MSERTARLSMPMLVPGQGQKDVTHNEALMALDALLHPSVRSRSLGVPPAAPELGACWLVPAGAGGAWMDRTDRLVMWTAGGWRFFGLPIGASLWVEDEAVRLQADASGWRIEAPSSYPALPVPSPAGGAVIDVQARAAIGALVDRLQHLGLISS